MNDVSRMKELLKKIKEADIAYFEKDAPIMTDREYDALVSELGDLEKKTGIRFSDSPTERVGGNVKKELPKVQHSKPMLSVKKTKSMDEIKRFAKNHDVLLSWKMDGLTLVLRYENGAFVKAITRGSDGMIGEDVTAAVKYFRNIPHRVSCREPFEVRGEGVASWRDHEALSKHSSDVVSHPRNTAASLTRSIVPDKSRLSHLDFYAFELIMEDSGKARRQEELNFLTRQGFAVVEHTLVRTHTGDEALESAIKSFDPEKLLYPADGIVIDYDDIAYAKSLGATAHHENCRIALKWSDELFDTTFRSVELVTTRTGIVSIVGLFDPVVIDSSTVKRAFLHNLSNFEDMKLGIGDTIRVYKANMIIPQIAENKTKSGSFELPLFCPSCGEALTVKYSLGGVKNLYCPNEECIARNAQKIARFCDKDAMNISGLSAVTLEKLMEYGWVKNFCDLYNLERYRNDIAATSGFGIASYEKIYNAVEKSRNTTLDRFLVGVGIPLMGPQAAKTLHTYFYGSFEQMEKAIRDGFAFSHIDGISETLEKNIYAWYNSPTEEKLFKPLLKELRFSESTGVSGSGVLAGANVVITGTLSSMTRAQAHELLRLMGANPTDNVSQNTNYLIVGMDPGGKKVSKALTYGTKMLYEHQLAELLGRD